MLARYLVYAETPVADFHSTARPSPYVSSGPAKSSMSAHILVVEPETALQAALSSWLEWEGYDCACASDPEEALAIAEHDRADVALEIGRAHV